MRIGGFQFDKESRELRLDGAVTRLSVKAADVLAMLTEKPGGVCSRDALLERVWPKVIVGEENLTQAIAELRRAFGDSFRAPRFIETVYKYGYRLAAPVSHEAGPVETGCAPPELDIDAYTGCLRAFELYDHGGRENTTEAIRIYADAAARQPAFAMAHAGLAKTLTFWGTFYEPKREHFDRAATHCEAALALDPACAEAWSASGFLIATRTGYTGGLDRFRRALELNPGAAETHQLLGRICFARAAFGQAAILLERAAGLRGDDFHSLLRAGKARARLGDHVRAEADYRLALIRIEASLQAFPNFYRALCDKAHCLWELGDRDEALALMESIRSHPDPMPYHEASLCVRIGETADALHLLEDTVDGGWRHPTLLDVDPDFDRIRDDRRFKRTAGAVAASAQRLF